MHMQITYSLSNAIRTYRKGEKCKKPSNKIPHQILDHASTNLYLSFISAARIQYDIFYNPWAQRTSYPHHGNGSYKQNTSVCVQKNLKKIRLTRAHICNTAKKITDTKKVYRKLQYELL